jgi:hypothetical protein
MLLCIDHWAVRRRMWKKNGYLCGLSKDIEGCDIDLCASAGGPPPPTQKRFFFGFCGFVC